MKSHGVAQLLATLGVTKSHSRPHVSNDNPFSESQFKTLKYRPDFPDRFGSQQDAHAFCKIFFSWYNDEHYHSGIGMLTPAMVHYGHADTVLDQRQRVLNDAFATHPERFVKKPPQPLSGPTEVWINPPQTKTPPIETSSSLQPPASESELEISLLTSAEQPARLLTPANLEPSLNKAITQTTSDGDQKPSRSDEVPILLHCPTPPASEARYTNFESQLSQTR